MTISGSLFGLDCLGHVSKGHKVSAGTIWKSLFFLDQLLYTDSFHEALW